LESFEYFKICEVWEKVSITKVVPNISIYLHNFSWDFTILLAIFPEPGIETCENLKKKILQGPRVSGSSSLPIAAVGIRARLGSNTYESI
jgi:hypothetical protein